MTVVPVSTGLYQAMWRGAAVASQPTPPRAAIAATSDRENTVQRPSASTWARRRIMSASAAQRLCSIRAM